MGDRYHWYEPCPNCKERMSVYYAESCESTDAKCHKCGTEYDIVMTWRLVEKKDDSKGI